jgi:hypothetical protein
MGRQIPPLGDGIRLQRAAPKIGDSWRRKLAVPGAKRIQLWQLQWAGFLWGEKEWLADAVIRLFSAQGFSGLCGEASDFGSRQT